MVIVDPSSGREVAGRYRILRSLGSGSMGAVFLAEELQSRQPVAIKEIGPALLRVPGARQRFKNEISALLSVRHPNIVRGIEYVEEADYLALVMEYVEGETLAHFLQQGPASEGEVATMLLQLAEGLAAVHAQGIVHRDLKPENVFVATTGQVKIGDFGVAGLGGTSTLTQQGRLVGTAKYFAPEYIETGECDARGDLYAVGVLGFELLAGASPFKATKLQDMLAERFKTTFAEDLKVLSPTSSPDLIRIIARAMNVSLMARYQSARELAADLEKFLQDNAPALADSGSIMSLPSGADATAAKHPVSTPRWIALLLGAVLVVGVIVIAIVLAR